MSGQRYTLPEAARLTGYSLSHLWKLARAGTLRTEQRDARAHHFVTEDELRRTLGYGRTANRQESPRPK